MEELKQILNNYLRFLERGYKNGFFAFEELNQVAIDSEFIRKYNVLYEFIKNNSNKIILQTEENGKYIHTDVTDKFGRMFIKDRIEEIEIDKNFNGDLFLLQGTNLTQLKVGDVIVVYDKKTFICVNNDVLS